MLSVSWEVMQYLPIADADAGVAALMTLVAIVAAEVMHIALFVDGDLINGKKTEAGTVEFRRG